MTEQQEKTIDNILSKLEIDKWYNTKGDKELIEAIKLCHDLHENILFSDDYSAFKKVQTMKEYFDEMDDPGGINIKFEFHKMEDVSFDYSHLEGNEPPKMDSKAWGKKAGRGI